MQEGGGSGERGQEIAGSYGDNVQVSWRKCVTIPFENPGSQPPWEAPQGPAPTQHLVDRGGSVLMSEVVSALSAAGAQH